MLKIGLTGSIGTGKSTIANMFAQLGVKIWSADDAVHKLYLKNGLANIELIKLYKNILNENGDIDRAKLSNIIIENKNNIKIIEKIVHPLVKDDREKFILNAQKAFEKYVILDIPLLFETNSQNEFDKIIVTHCPYEIQKQRVLARPNFNKEKFEAIIKQQIPSNEKIKMANFVIDTNQSIDQTNQIVIKIHQELNQNA